MGHGRRTSPNLVAFFPPALQRLAFSQIRRYSAACLWPAACNHSERVTNSGRKAQINKRRKHMSHRDIIRAWKDAEFRSSLSEAERAMLPSHPAGSIELADPELDRTMGRASGLRVKSTLKAGSMVDCRTH